MITRVVTSFPACGWSAAISSLASPIGATSAGKLPEHFGSSFDLLPLGHIRPRIILRRANELRQHSSVVFVALG